MLAACSGAGGIKAGVANTAPDGETHTGADAGSARDSSPAVEDGGIPAGWLYTKGNKIYLSDGKSGVPWMGRGVNIDDIYLCGFNYMLSSQAPDATLEGIVGGLMSGWKPNFVRVSLGMASYPKVASWLTNPAEYKTPMTNVIHAIAASPNVYVLVALRSDASMIGQDEVDGDPEATGLPSDSTTTPSKVSFPTGTDTTYEALIDTFATSGSVLFGLTNEPGGDKLSDAQISAAMSHAVGVIRAEEDRLGVPHHLVSVQGNGWTSNISFYASAPLPYDNVVYEVHGYPPAPSSYTYANIPVIIGEYGSLTDSAGFYADVEAKRVPNLAWDFEPYSNCSPDLLTVDKSDTTLVPSAWGMTVQKYLAAHAL
jgi:cellulase (glycosyl hydrolase family 5)